MHHLEVPQPLSRARVEREQRRAEQIRAVAIGAVEIVGRRSERESRRCLCTGSTVISPQVLTPPMYFHASGGHVS